MYLSSSRALCSIYEAAVVTHLAPACLDWIDSFSSFPDRRAHHFLLHGFLGELGVESNISCLLATSTDAKVAQLLFFKLHQETSMSRGVEFVLLHFVDRLVLRKLAELLPLLVLQVELLSLSV